jgi:hypothetical protein
MSLVDVFRPNGEPELMAGQLRAAIADDKEWYVAVTRDAWIG